LKFKQLLKIAIGRSVGAFCSVSRDLLNRFTEAEYRNCFERCGHR